MIPFPFQRGGLGRRILRGAALPAGQVTWSPTDKAANLTLSNANRRAASSASGYQGGRGVTSRDSGKWYVEYNFVSNGNEVFIGLGQSTTALGTISGLGTLGGEYFVMYIVSGGSSTWRNGAQVTASTGARSANQRIGFSLDLPANQAIAYVNGSVVSTYNGIPAGNYFPYVNLFQPGGAVELLQDALFLPSGFNLWTDNFVAPRNAFDPANIPASTTSGTLSDGNRTWTSNTPFNSGNINANRFTPRNTVPPGLKWYFEITYTSISLGGTGYMFMGVGSSYIWWTYPSTHQVVGTNTTAIPAPTNGMVIMVAIDDATGQIWYGRDGTWYNTGTGTPDPAAGTGPAATYSPGSQPAMNFQGRTGASGTTQVATVNFGQAAYAYSPPAGFNFLA